MSALRSLSPVVRVLCLLLLVLTLSRIFLVAWYWGRVAATDGIDFILLQGLRFDIVLVGMVLGPALLAAPWFAGRKPLGRLLQLYLVLATVFVVFLELGTIPFIDQYDTRPNYLFVEYLRYPNEVFATLIASYSLFLALMACGTLVLGIFAWKLSRPVARKSPGIRWSRALLIAPLTLVVLLFMIRSTLGHRPVNPSTAAFSTDSMVNTLPLNSPYTLLYAIYEQHRDSKHGFANYGKMADSEVLRIVVERAGISNKVDLHSDEPTMHLQTATRRLQSSLNLVIILQESLGAEFVGSLGGKDLTPNLDALANEGIWFERLYATGTRSARGIEAIVAGLPPTSKRSVVKLAETQEDFFTFARLLKNQGYQTSFIYGGESHFDNMRRFFLNNGIQTIIDENDYKNPQFRGSWGVSDEDLFLRAHQYFEERCSQPFFSLVFTSSNHQPFDIPSGKVRAESGPDGGRDAAVRYADYALGKFINTARSSSYFENTVFLVVSDHNSRVYGDQLVPVERFHVPAVILGGSIEARRIPGISSHVDLFPTLLSLIGVDGRHPSIGYDLTAEQHFHGSGRAQLQFYTIHAWLVPGRVVVLQPDLPMQSFLYQPPGRLIPDPAPDQEIMRQALAHALYAPLMVRKGGYWP